MAVLGAVSYADDPVDVSVSRRGREEGRSSGSATIERERNGRHGEPLIISGGRRASVAGGLTTSSSRSAALFFLPRRGVGQKLTCFVFGDAFLGRGAGKKSSSTEAGRSSYGIRSDLWPGSIDIHLGMGFVGLGLKAGWLSGSKEET